MGGFRNRLAIAAGVGLIVSMFAGCQTPSGDLMDLRRNSDLYQSPRYRAKVPVDRMAFIAPLVDERDGANAAVVDAAGRYPTRYVGEKVWSRPLTEMIEEIVRDEFADSDIFMGLQRSLPPERDALVVKPALIAARCGSEEHISGRRSMAMVGFRVTVFGPDATGQGARTKLLDETFIENVKTEVVVRPGAPELLFGSALNRAVAKMLAGIDQSNVARSGVPIEVPMSSDDR